MRVLNKQKLEREIRSLFRELQGKKSGELTEESFNDKLSRVLSRNELELNGHDIRFINVLIGDIRGFTYVVEKCAPAQIITILNYYFGVMVEIIDRHGGHVDKFMGDSVIAYFENTEDIKSSVLTVLKCAIEMQIAMDEVNRKCREMGIDNLYMGIGINTGEVVASVLGSDLYREYTMIGKHVNLASRIEGYTLRGQILLSVNSWKYVSDQIETGELNEVNAKGMQEPLQFYSLYAINSPERLELPKRENRKAPRIQVRIPLQFQLLEGKNILPDVYEGEVLDISYGGMSICSAHEINQFSDLKMSIKFSPFSSDALDVYAKALYVQPHEKGQEVGLEFTIIDDDTSAAVKNFVDNLI